MVSSYTITTPCARSCPNSTQSFLTSMTGSAFVSVRFNRAIPCRWVVSAWDETGLRLRPGAVQSAVFATIRRL